jgi:hypothetical protein
MACSILPANTMNSAIRVCPGIQQKSISARLVRNWIVAFAGMPLQLFAVHINILARP